MQRCKELTFVKLGDKVLGDLLKLGRINSELIFQFLNLTEKVFRHIGHRSCVT